MSTTRGSSGLPMSGAGMSRRWVMQRNQSLVQTYLLSAAVLPVSAPRNGDSFRLPALSRSTHGRTTTVPLSISEPALFAPDQRASFKDHSKSHQALYRYQASSQPSNKTLETPKISPESHHHVYLHFSQPLKPVPKPSNTFTRRIRENRGLQPLVSRCKLPQNLETLSVKGTTCVLSQHSAISCSSSSSRTQLHVFLPAEGTRLEDDRDSESVDEGFMDELDNKISSLKLQQNPKTSRQSEKEKPLMGEISL
ncbi:hypothetical protein DNTS_011355 [Danionella cerebrum]|uniref:Uncharacterized protein n=1 Tax=Danionella cerebrum TaxID=2873325 RepID=A0A553QWT0_9TELE|nr:hypothetical protein DNTS_011355 [Danionella translucida]